MKQRENLKKSLAVLVMLLSIGLPLACTTNNSSSPTTPITVGSTNTPTGTISPAAPTATRTPTLLPGATPTFTPTLAATPAFASNTSLSAAPNAFYVNGSSILVGEGELKSGGDVSMIESYTLSGGSLSGGTDGNEIVFGIPTPAATPPWQGTLLVMSNPVGFAHSGGTYAVLDSAPAIGASGGATLYESDGGFFGPHENVASGYGGSTFVKPTAMVSDSLGNFYIADAGAGYVDEFGGVGYPPVQSPSWEHRWSGPDAAEPFKKPVAVACDTSNNVYVADAGYSPSKVQEYASEGTTILGDWNLVTGSVVNGLAVDSVNNVFYVSDIGNMMVEEYKIIDYSTVSLVTEWGDPHGPHEYLPFMPSCIALIGTYVIVGDTANDMLQVFGP